MKKKIGYQPKIRCIYLVVNTDKPKEHKTWVLWVHNPATIPYLRYENMQEKMNSTLGS